MTRHARRSDRVRSAPFPHRALVAAGLAAVLAALGHVPEAGGAGTIVTAGATIAAGAAASQGSVTIDDCAAPAQPPARPAVGNAPAQGQVRQQLPSKPDTGDGTDGALVVSTATVVPGGEYDHTLVDLQLGGSIHFDGATVLRVAGDVTLSGPVSCSGNIQILAGGSIVALDHGGLPMTGVTTSSGLLRLEADAIELGITDGSSGGTIPTPNVVELRATSGVILRAHGTNGAQDVAIADTTIASSFGAVTAHSARSVSFADSGVTTSGGGRLLAEQGTILIERCGMGFDSGEVIVEAVGAVTFDEAELFADQGALFIEAFGGDVTLSRSTVTSNSGVAIGVSVDTGELFVGASGGVTIDRSSQLLSSGDGGMNVVAYGGDVAVETPGENSEGSDLDAQGSGPMLLEASNDVSVFGASDVDSISSLTVRAYGGDVRVGAPGEFRSNGPTIDVRAQDGIHFGPDAVTGRPSLNGQDVVLSAGIGGISFAGDVLADRELTMQGRGDVLLDGTFEASSQRNLEVVSETGSITASNAMLTTQSGAATITGDVVLECFGGSSAAIDASNATITSGDAPGGSSGDVKLIVHADGTVESFVLPKVAKVRIKESKPEKSSVITAGFFDTGPDAVDLSGPATITVGGLEFAGTLEPNTKGTKFVFRANGDRNAKLTIKPAGSGSSRAKYRLVLKTDLMGLVPTDGPLSIRFATSSADGGGTVVMENGKYKLGRRRGLLTSPNVFPFKVKQVHKGAGKDSVAVLVGVATDGGAPPAPADLTISVGDLSFTVPGGEFTVKGDKHVAKSPASAPDVTKLQVDYLREQITLVAKKLDLGPIPGPGRYEITVNLGDESRTVAVRMSPKSSSVYKY